MQRTLALLALAAISLVPLVVAGSRPSQGSDEELSGPPFGPAYDDAPVFDGRLPEGTVAIAHHPLRWSPRQPGRTDHGRTTDWPAAVERAFIDRMRATEGERDLAAEFADVRVGGAWRDGFDGFRAVVPGGLEVYAVEHPAGWIPSRILQVLVRRPSTGEVGQRVGWFSLRWTSTGDEGPRARWADLDGDGAMELGFELHHHNGTVSDGDFVRWFRIADDLALEQVHVSRLWDRVSVVSRGEVGRITYRLLRDADGALRDEGWFDNPSYGVGQRRVPERSADFEWTEPFSSR